jgi:pimeloyl-ACP methyl ester carboxylesterase
MRLLGKILLYILLGFFSLVLIFIIFLWIKSPGTTKAFIGKDGKQLPSSIAVIEKPVINGAAQVLIIRGEDTANPVLLYLHGGPGSPEWPFFNASGAYIENLFTVCYWEQRGAGKSYSEDIPDSTFTLNQFVEDAASVTRYLMKKFNKPKIYLMGHSWGTVLGSYTAKKYPEYYYAYLGIGQVGEQIRAEQISYDFVLQSAKDEKDEKAVSFLTKLGRPPYSSAEAWVKKMLQERQYVTRYGGDIKNGNFYTMVVKAMVNCREYTLKEKFNYLKANDHTLTLMISVVMDAHLFNDVAEQTIPVYIFQGTHDYQTAYPIAKEYFDSLKAPVKKFYTFDNSAHSPNFEEPKKFEEILRKDVLKK